MKKYIFAFAVAVCFMFMCVQNGYAHPTITECLTCHSFPALGGLHLKVGHASCTSCHVTPGDNTPAPSKCAVCHPTGNPGACNLVVKHSTGNCMDCHGDKDVVTVVCSTSTCPAAKVLGDADPRLATLRQFRDKVLAKSAFGKRIINIYYNNADAINASLEKNPTLKAFSYKALQSFIPVAEIFM